MDDKLSLICLIRDAFHKVKLGRGVGLLESQGHDDHADDATLAAYRARDEKEDWSRIDPALLDRCTSSLSFFDAEGMRFHLPAFIVADLEGMLSQDIVFYLTWAQGNESEFSLLNAQQRDAVGQFLRFHLSELDDSDRAFEGPKIEGALRTFWNVGDEDVSS